LPFGALPQFFSFLNTFTDNPRTGTPIAIDGFRLELELCLHQFHILLKSPVGMGSGVVRRDLYEARDGILTGPVGNLKYRATRILELL
jgi:hypothetical protein